MGEYINITVDGPVASGKGAATKGLSKLLGIPVLDTGAIYRAVTVYFLENGIDANDEKAAIFALPRCDLRVFVAEGQTKVFLSGRDVSGKIRENKVSQVGSVVAAYPTVRNFVNAKIADIVQQGDFILEGRDTGSAVIPNAKYKFYLTASTEERARRRQKELLEKGETVSFLDMLIQIKERDERDMTRNIAPLTRAKNSILIDNTKMTVEQTIDSMAKYIDTVHSGYNIGHGGSHRE
jgi:cytidylate kinase